MADIWARDRWARDALWGGGGVGPGPAVVVVKTREYQLTLHDENDTFVAFLPNFDNASWTEEVNRPDVLEFDYPSRDAIAASFVQPNQVWLRDKANDNALLQRFRIITPTLEAPFPDVIHVECQDWMSQLREEWITSFQRSTSDGADFKEVIDGYLDFQVNTKQVHRGVMSAAIKNRDTNTWATNKSILDAIETIHETVGGHYHVDAFRRLAWKERLGPSSGQQFRIRKNIQNLTREGPDFSEVINRLYAYGNGSNRATRLNLIDAGEPVEYVRDAASEAAYNIKSGLWRDSEIEDAAELLAAANFVLEQRKDPRVSYSVGVVDLAFDPSTGKNFEDILLGSVWWVIDEQVNIQTQQIVVKITRDLRDVTNVQLEITNIPRDLSNMFKRLFKGLEELEVEDSADLLGPLVSDGLTTVRDIAWWNEDTNTGNLGSKITDLMAADPTAILSDVTPEAVVTSSAGAAGTGVKASREDHDHPADLVSDTTPEIVQGLSDAAAGVGTKAARFDHVHGGIQLIVQATEPAAADWPQGGVWIDSSVAFFDPFQATFYLPTWIKTIDSPTSNASKMQITIPAPIP